MNIFTYLKQAEKDLKLAQEVAVRDLPEEALANATQLIETTQKSLDAVQDYLEKFMGDKLAVKTMEMELHKQIEASPLHKGMSAAEKKAVVDAIINDKAKHLLTEEELSKYVQQSLSKLSDEDLLLRAYSKQDILSLGKMLSTNNISDGTAYARGLEALQKQMMSEKGVEEAIALAQKKVMTDPKSKRHYLLSYYGVVDGQ